MEAISQFVSKRMLWLIIVLPPVVTSASSYYKKRKITIKMHVLGPGRTRQLLCILRKKLSSFPWNKCARWIFFPPNFVKHYQTSQAPLSCFGAGQIFVRCENRTDFAICTAWPKEKVFNCAHDYQIENLAETNFVEIFGRAKQILSVQCVRTPS